MTDTIKPPDRPKSPRPPRPYARKDETLARTGDKPRSRPGDKRDDSRSNRPSPRPAEPAPREDDARIAKVMARAGLCSRRDAESWIAAGRVAVNGAVIDSPALNVKAEDVITVDGMSLPDREPTRLFMFHKPRGLVTTSRDPEGRPTIFENLPEGLPRVVSVGRLDINTEGLMLLTNDGGLARVLELPATGWLRRYRVRANGEIDQARLDTLKTGITIDGVAYAGIEATLDRIQGSNAWLTMGLREGKNREIKRVLETLGLAVTRLIRISFGPFQLGDLAEGLSNPYRPACLRDQLGPGLAAEAGSRPRQCGGADVAPVAAGMRPEPLVDATPEPHPCGDATGACLGPAGRTRCRGAGRSATHRAERHGRPQRPRRQGRARDPGRTEGAAAAARAAMLVGSPKSRPNPRRVGGKAFAARRRWCRRDPVSSPPRTRDRLRRQASRRARGSRLRRQAPRRARGRLRRQAPRRARGRLRRQAAR